MRTPHRLPVALALVVAVVAASLTARAQSADAPATFARGIALFAEAAYREAFDAFSDAVVAAAVADDADLERRARREKVRSALRIAEFDVARREASALMTGPDVDAETLVINADSLWASGLFDEAETAYRDVLRLDPASALGRLGLARSLASRTQLGEALVEALAARAHAPDDSEAHAVAGGVYERLLRFEEAAIGYEAYAARLPPAEKVAIVTARARATFLRSFNDRIPFAVRDRDADALHRVPFKLVKNKIVVQGRLNGVSVDLVLDTGAERMALAPETAARARLRPVTTSLTAGVGSPAWRRVALARLDTLEIGPLRMRNVPVSIRPPVQRGAPRWQGETLSPLALGLSVVVDYQRRQITLGRHLPDEPADVTLPLRVHRLPVVRGELNGAHVFSFVVDTGGEMMSLSSEAAQALGPLPERRIRLRVFGLAGLDESAFLLPGVDLTLEAIRYQKVGLAVLNLRAPSVLLGFQLGGILGHKFLADYHVAIDMARSQVRLVRSPH
jgi:tetratricopeptide (TPR) repeat protein